MFFPARLHLSFLCVLAPLCRAQEVKPAVEQVSENQFRIGLISFEKTAREIRFPAAVNMSEGLLEFLIVHEKGKIHESLLSTSASPLHLRLALNLLSYQPSPELSLQPDDTFPAVPAGLKKSAALAIHLEWDDAGKTRRVDAREWVRHTALASAMPATHWVFSEADIVDGKFSPEATGDLAAIYLTHSALISYPGKDNRDDTVWEPFPKRVPPVGTPVTVIISPYPVSP